MADRTSDFFRAASKFGHRKSNYLDSKINERHHASYKSSYLLDGISIFKKIGETNNLLKHLIMNSQSNSSLFDGSQKITIQIKDEITGINFEINDLKNTYQSKLNSSQNSMDEDKN